jgi:hypothetical protein
MTEGDYLRWGFAALLACFGLYVALLNVSCIWMWYFRRRHGSMVPLLGGGAIALALLIVPLPEFAAYAWLPLLIDPGCLLMIGGGLGKLAYWWLCCTFRNFPMSAISDEYVA